MKDLLIQNAQIVSPEAVIADASLIVHGGLIEAILDEKSINRDHFAKVIDAQGQYLLPGIIDIHTDAIEKEIHPRPGANFPIEVAFRELERRMSGCGITTVFHSIYLGYYAAEDYGEIDRRLLFNEINELCRSHTIIDNRIHLRFEITGVEEYQTCLDLIEAGCVQMLSFMDHTPGQGQYGMDKYSKYLRAQGKTEAEIEIACAESLQQERLSEAQMKAISSVCRQYNIPIASHDDDNPGKVASMHRIGATICEFPINFEAAQHAIELGMPTVGGASNVLRGGSLSGNLNVQKAIEARLINTLCSDYYPPAILHALFKLEKIGSLRLPEAVQLATLSAAKASGMAKEKGSIELGKEADLILVDLSTGIPVVTHTFLKGKTVAQAGFRTAANQ
jgi:alpha-D-ribose 1-methylphosphonate 5-triphosphate diphosphatase